MPKMSKFTTGDSGPEPRPALHSLSFEARTYDVLFRSWERDHGVSRNTKNMDGTIWHLFWGRFTEKCSSFSRPCSTDPISEVTTDGCLDPLEKRILRMSPADMQTLAGPVEGIYSGVCHSASQSILSINNKGPSSNPSGSVTPLRRDTCCPSPGSDQSRWQNLSGKERKLVKL